MAYTKIWEIKGTLNKALDYIENPDKTQQQLLVSGYNTDPLFASVEFEMTAALAKQMKGDYTKTGGSNILAYHMIQSFSRSDKCTPKQAHEIGKQWADEVLGGKYEYVIATHVDKGQVHNHIIFNAVSFYDYKKFKSVPYKTAALLRRKSDKICEEHGLSVIKRQEQTRAEKVQWRAKIKKIIDEAILKSKTYEEFQHELSKQNIEIKDGKRISFRVLDSEQKRFVRGDTIGQEYSKEYILLRIEQSDEEKRLLSSVLEKKGITTEKIFLESLKHSENDSQIHRMYKKSKLTATKQMAQVLLTLRSENITQVEDLQQNIQKVSQKLREEKQQLKDLTIKNQEYKVVAKCLKTFQDYLPIKQEYEKKMFFLREKYYARYQGELRSFDYAAQKLEQMGISSDADLDKVLEMVKTQDQKAAEVSANIKQDTKRLKEMKTALQIIQTLSPEVTYPLPEKKHKEESR